MESNANRIELEEVTVESPCPKRWQELEGGERRRFCDECSLHVINLSALTREEGQELLDERDAGERLCVSFNRRADGSLMTAVRTGPWRTLARMAAGFLFALFPLLAACRQTTGTPELVTNGDGAPPTEGPTGCIELTGEVALPLEGASQELEVPEAILGRIAAPVQETPAPVEHPDGSDAGR